MHNPRDNETAVTEQRRINGKTAIFNIGQQMGEIALERENPVMLAERIDKRGIRMIKPDQR
ncbi:hypothetical protein D3C75_1383790 [compost metagenome]